MGRAIRGSTPNCRLNIFGTLAGDDSARRAAFGQMARARWEVAAEYLQRPVAKGALRPCSLPSRKQCRDVLCRFSEKSGRELWIGHHSGQSQGTDQRRKRNQRSPLGGLW